MRSFLLFITLFMHLALNAQQPSKIDFYNAYIKGDMRAWARNIEAFERTKPQSVDAKLELVCYYYAHIAFLLGTKKYDEAQKYMSKGETIIAEVLKLQPRNATALAFNGSFIGFRIGISKFKAISLGPESNRSIELALEIAPNNIQANADKANALYHTPRLFGGSKTESLKLYSKAVRLIEQANITDHNWFYLNLLTLQAQNHEALGQNAAAKAVYEKILRFEPNYSWVRNELLPALLKKM